MNVAVISDLHLGTGGRADQFGHEDNEFLKFLDHLEKNFEKVVLLGDIWETLTAPALHMRAAELRTAQRTHSEIHRRFMRDKYVYVHGNHDLVANSADRAPEEYVLEADGVRLLFTHGHQGDYLCYTRPKLVALGVWAGAWIQRLGLDLIYSSILKWEHGRHADVEGCQVRRWAEHSAALRSFDVVVTGHTHVPTKSENSTSLFLNSGACAEGAISFLSLDTKRGDYEVNFGY